MELEELLAKLSVDGGTATGLAHVALAGLATLTNALHTEGALSSTGVELTRDVVIKAISENDFIEEPLRERLAEGIGKYFRF